MRTIKLYCDIYGNTTVQDNKMLVLSNANEEVTIEINFQDITYASYRKRVDILVEQDGNTDYIEQDVAKVLTFELTREYTKQGKITLQPIAYQYELGVDYIDSPTQKWKPIKLDVQYSINATESTTNVDTPLGFVLQQDIEAIKSKLLDTEITDVQDKDMLIYNASTQTWINDHSLTVPRYDDLTFELTQTRVGSNLKPDFDYTNVGLLFPQNNTTEQVLFTVQLPHAWLEGSTIYPHLHIVQAQNLQATFRIEYKWYNIGDVVPSVWSTYDLNTYVSPYVSSSISNILRGSNGISGVGKTLSSILKIKLYRTDNVYVGDLLADQFDIHILKDGFGSQEQFDKY